MEEIKSIKGFNPDMTCLGFQYEVGKTYEIEGDVAACRSGFHACPSEDPLAVWRYYPPITDNGVTVYADVTQSGEIDKEGYKIASARITIDANVSLPDFIRRAVAAIVNKCTTGDWAHAATTGTEAHAATTGDWAHAATTGREAHAATTGHWAHAATTGREAHAATTGREAHAATTGREAHAATTGHWAHAATTGRWAHAATTGRWAHAATTGRWAHAATTGTEAHAATTGTEAHAATTGDRAHAATTGDRAHAATTGREAHAEVTSGKASAMSAGSMSKVRGVDGSALHCNEISEDGTIISAACGIVGRDGIKSGVWYRCEGGNLVEVAQ
jgi:hypothetical protein